MAPNSLNENNRLLFHPNAWPKGVHKENLSKRKTIIENLPLEIDVLVVGGGIVGAGIFRELALHGTSTLLIDRGDFNAQTSQSSSKMLHGGIRYLENLDFALVWEALHEKKYWIKNTPHLCREEKFFLPVYKETKYPLWMVQVALWLYAILSGLEKWPHWVLRKRKAQKILPEIKKENLRGTGIYYDAIVDDHKLGLEVIYDALYEKNAYALNYAELLWVEKNDKENNSAFIKVLEGTNQYKTIKIKARKVLFALGPFTDQILSQKLKNYSFNYNPTLLLSQGSHLWLKPQSLKLENSLVLQTNDNRIIFVIPQEKGILVGTTEVSLKNDDDIFNIQATPEEIDYLLSCLQSYFPHSNITKESILSTFAGVRPLVHKGGKNAHKTSRNHVIKKLDQDLFMIVGGKYTTFRIMAQDLVKKVLPELGIKYQAGLNLKALRQKSLITLADENLLTPEILEKICDNELVISADDLLHRRLSLISWDNIQSPSVLETLENFIAQHFK